MKNKILLSTFAFLVIILALTVASAATPYYRDSYYGSRIAYPPHSYDAHIYPYYNSYTRYERVDRNYFAPSYTVYNAPRPVYTVYNYPPNVYHHSYSQSYPKVRYISYSPRHTSMGYYYP